MPSALHSCQARYTEIFRRLAVNGDRDRLAAALVEGAGGQMPPGHVWNVDKALVPVMREVRTMQAEAAAEALEEAAEVVSRSRGIKFHGAAVRDLRDRAAALRAVTSHHVAPTDGTDGPESPVNGPSPSPACTDNPGSSERR
jgi:hypothetical protein